MTVLDQIERHAIEWALREAGGEVVAAAEILGLPTRTLYHRIHRCGIDLATVRAADRSSASATLAELCEEASGAK